MDKQEEKKVQCPKCGSDQFVANKKGFSGGKAVAGAIITGPIGLLAGTLGSSKIKITCLACGHTFKPGDHAKPVTDTKKEEPLTTAGCLTILAIVAVVALLLYKC